MQETANTGREDLNKLLTAAIIFMLVVVAILVGLSVLAANNNQDESSSTDVEEGISNDEVNFDETDQTEVTELDFKAALDNQTVLYAINPDNQIDIYLDFERLEYNVQSFELYLQLGGESEIREVTKGDVALFSTPIIGEDGKKASIVGAFAGDVSDQTGKAKIATIELAEGDAEETVISLSTSDEEKSIIVDDSFEEKNIVE